MQLISQPKGPLCLHRMTFKGAFWLLALLQGVRAANPDGPGKVVTLATAVTVPPGSTPVVDFAPIQTGPEKSPTTISSSIRSSVPSTTKHASSHGSNGNGSPHSTRNTLPDASSPDPDTILSSRSTAKGSIPPPRTTSTGSWIQRASTTSTTDNHKSPQTTSTESWIQKPSTADNQKPLQTTSSGSWIHKASTTPTTDNHEPPRTTSTGSGIHKASTPSTMDNHKPSSSSPSSDKTTPSVPSGLEPSSGGNSQNRATGASSTGLSRPSNETKPPNNHPTTTTETTTTSGNTGIPPNGKSITTSDPTSSTKSNSGPDPMSTDTSALAKSSSEGMAAIADYAPTGTPSHVEWGTLTAAPTATTSGSSNDDAIIIGGYLDKLWKNKEDYKKKESRKKYKDHVDDDIVPRIDNWIKTNKVDESKSSCSGSRKRSFFGDLGNAVKGAADTAAKIGSSTVNEASSAVENAASDLVPCIKKGLKRMGSEMPDDPEELPDDKIKTIDNLIDDVTSAGNAWKDMEEKLKKKKNDKDDENQSNKSESQESTESSTQSSTSSKTASSSETTSSATTSSSTKTTNTSSSFKTTSSSKTTSLSTKTTKSLSACKKRTPAASRSIRTITTDSDTLTIPSTTSIALDTNTRPLTAYFTGSLSKYLTTSQDHIPVDIGTGSVAGASSGTPTRMSTRVSSTKAPGTSPDTSSDTSSATSPSTPAKTSTSASSQTSSESTSSESSTTTASETSTTSSASATPTAGIYIAIDPHGFGTPLWKAFIVKSGDANKEPDYCEMEPTDSWVTDQDIKVPDVPFPEKRRFSKDSKISACVYTPGDKSAGEFACPGVKSQCTTDFKGYLDKHTCGKKMIVPKVLCQLSSDDKVPDG